MRDPRRVARDLLGKILVRRQGRQTLTARIVETEAYLGQGDPAAHAAAGRTQRNAVIFGPPGRAYVYFIYGNHYCLNVSCQPAGKAGCVLFRAAEPISGIARMAKNRGLQPRRSKTGLSPADLRRVTNGPGKLTRALAITRAHNGVHLTDPTEALYLADDGSPKLGAKTTPRIGITKAKTLRLRYVGAGNQFVSKG
jgi:DNA-3-methyladenine glycosylase